MWVIATLAGLAGLIILVLCIPLDATLNIDTSGRPKFRLRLAWLFGLISKELRRGKKKPEEKKRVAKEKPKKRKGIGVKYRNRSSYVSKDPEKRARSLANLKRG